MADIIQLVAADADTCAEINVLLRQLSERIPLCSPELLQNIITNPNLELWVVTEDDKVVGMGELAIVLKPEGVIAQIEDVIVDESQRGKGLGKILMEKLIERAKAHGAREAALTSRAERLAANALYKKLGFEIHETNVYKMRF